MTDYFADIVPTQDVGGPDYFADIFPQKVSTARDVVQSIPQNIETYLSSGIGLAGDVANTATRGLEHLGVHPLRMERMPQYTGSADVQNYFNEQQGGPLYQPQTPVGRTINTGAAIAPAALGGPEAVSAKLIPRVLAPAAAITGIEAAPESVVPAKAKPWLEVATVMLAPFGANPAIRAVINQTKRWASVLPGRAGEVGVLPTTAELAKAKTVLEHIRNTTKDPQKQQMSQVALDEISKRHHSMEVLDQATGGNASRARYGKNAAQFQENVAELLSDVKKGLHPDTFTPEQIAQMETVVKGTPGMKMAKKAGELGVLGGHGGAQTAGLLSLPGVMHLVQGGDVSHSLAAATVPTITSIVGKAFEAGLTLRQIDTLVKYLQRGTGRPKVPGAPAAFGRRPDFTYSPLQVPLATDFLPQDEGNQ